MLERILQTIEQLQWFPRLSRVGRAHGTYERVVAGTPYITSSGCGKTRRPSSSSLSRTVPAADPLHSLPRRPTSYIGLSETSFLHIPSAASRTWARTPSLPKDEGRLVNTIRSINDHFRATCVAINVTPSIQALGPEFFRRAIKIVRHYDNFREDVNPYEEHDCGTFKLDGYECAWAIDCYNRDMSGPSADPCNVNITTRLLTIALAHEL